MGKGWLTGVGRRRFNCNRSRFIQKAGKAEGERMAILTNSHKFRVSCYVLSSLRQKQLSLICPIRKNSQQHNSKHKSIFLASTFLQPISSQYTNLVLISSASFPHGFRVVFPAVVPTICIFQAPLDTEWNIWEGMEKLLAFFTLQWNSISFMVLFIKYH